MAFRAFFYGDFSGGPGRPSALRLRHRTHGRAWLEQVRVAPASLDVRQGGSAIAGAKVELNSAACRCDACAAETGQITLPLLDGLPPGAWLYLSRDRHWLDYRAIGDYAGAADLARAGVDVEVPEDLESEIQALLSQGEGLHGEFKRQLPEDSVDSKRTIFKIVAAFANGQGGSIVFGVQKDEATMCGLDGIDLIAERDRLAQLARSIVTPAPEVEAALMSATARRCSCSPSAAEPTHPTASPCPEGRTSRSSSTSAVTRRSSRPGQTRSGTRSLRQRRHLRALRHGAVTTRAGKLPVRCTPGPSWAGKRGCLLTATR